MRMMIRINLQLRLILNPIEKNTVISEIQQFFFYKLCNALTIPN